MSLWWGTREGTGECPASHIHGLVSNFNRTLKQKIWPGIPSPESEFEGLFTTHKGNFQVGDLSSLLLGLPCYRMPSPGL